MTFEELYMLYFKDIYLFILAMSGDPDIAEEITQETFFKALKSIDSFHGTCSVKTWLCQIGKNTYLSHLKREKRFSKETPENLSGHSSPDSSEAELSQSADSAEAIYLKKNSALSIYKVLHCLDEPYKEVFTLRALGDLSFQEIGEIFDRKEGWARVTYHRARQKLQKLLKEV